MQALSHIRNTLQRQHKQNGFILLTDNNNVVCNPVCRWFAGGSKIMIGNPCLVISNEVAGML